MGAALWTRLGLLDQLEGGKAGQNLENSTYLTLNFYRSDRKPEVPPSHRHTSNLLCGNHETIAALS
jgi:hypothetical protein